MPWRTHRSPATRLRARLSRVGMVFLGVVVLGLIPLLVRASPSAKATRASFEPAEAPLQIELELDDGPDEEQREEVVRVSDPSLLLAHPSRSTRLSTAKTSPGSKDETEPPLRPPI